MRDSVQPLPWQILLLDRRYSVQIKVQSVVTNAKNKISVVLTYVTNFPAIGYTRHLATSHMNHICIFWSVSFHLTQAVNDYWLRLWTLTTCSINIYTQILPLLTLYQYFTTYVCRDLQRAVDGRILKVRVLTDLGLFAEALITLLRLLHGDRLPHIGDSNFRQVESKMPAVMFDNSKPLNEQANLKVRFDWRS